MKKLEEKRRELIASPSRKSKVSELIEKSKQKRRYSSCPYLRGLVKNVISPFVAYLKQLKNTILTLLELSKSLTK